MSTAPPPGLARPNWPAPVRQEERTAADLHVLEQRLDQRIATIGAGDRWALGLVLGRCLGRLVARVAETPGPERLNLDAGLILVRYNVEASARIAAKKLRPTIRKVGP